jgi:F0F1-type ATP synthase assembly protein I
VSAIDGAATVSDHESGGGSGQPRPPWAYVGLGFEIVVPIVLGLLLGLWLDTRWGTRPWLAVTGVLLGIAAGFYNFFRVVLGTTKGGT